MKILAIDYGIARTGVATCDPLETIASPLCVIPSYNHEKLVAELLRVIKESGAQKLIIGKPLRTDGNKSEMAEKCEAFAVELRELTGMDVESVDERFTTVIASQHLHANSINAKKQKKTIDAAAAAVLLQGYIDSRKENCKISGASVRKPLFICLFYAFLDFLLLEAITKSTTATTATAAVTMPISIQFA